MAEHWQEVLLAFGVLSPMISFWVLVFYGPKLGKPASGWFTVVMGMGIPLACATAVGYHWWFVAGDAARTALTEASLSHFRLFALIILWFSSKVAQSI